jgi:hypothetical protein
MVYHSMEHAEQLGASPPRLAELDGRAHRGIWCKSHAFQVHLKLLPRAML